jgi:probable F420-dependent oxidoreductase
MDFGLQLAALPASDIVATAKQAEAWGYAAVYVPDHFAYERRDGSALDDQTPAWEATTILGAIATATSRVRVGALVLCNLFRHPATTAQVTTTVDHLSAGRAILGIGSGWTRAEFEMTGVAFPDIKPRLRMLDEAVRAIKALWTSERATFEGEFYHLRDAISVPKPVQKPHPPIMLGGGGKGLLRIAAREADIVNVVSASGHVGTIDPREVAKVTDEGFRAKLDFLRAEIKAAGRDPAAVTLSSTIFIAMLVDSRETAHAFAGSIGGLFGLNAEQVLRMPLALIGTADDCAAELRRREREWGISHYILSQGFAGPGFGERFAGEVMSRMAR